MKKKKLLKRIMDHWQLYMLLLPATIIVLLFKYYPIYGIQLAFKNMKIGQTIAEAKWVGFDNFRRFFSSGSFSRTFSNTLRLGLSTLLTFPLPIILALLLHNCVTKPIKKFTQTTTYIPYLISAAVVMSIVLLFCNGSTGFLNLFARRFGLSKVDYFGEEKFVLPIYIISIIWSTVGYNSVIYLAALSSVNPDLVDAAMIDGCPKIKKIWHIDLPAIAPTIVILLIMNMGGFFGASTERMLLIQTDLNLAKSETIGTYTYKIGLLSRQYGYSAAVDLFTNLVNFVLLVVTNFVSKKVSNTSLF